MPGRGGPTALCRGGGRGPTSPPRCGVTAGSGRSTLADPHEEEAAEEVVGAVDDPCLLETVARLAAGEPRVAALLSVLDAVSTAPHDVALLLDLAEQRSAGDPSPSHTFVPRDGLSPDAARKRAQRVRDRAHDFIAAHPEYSDLAELPVLAKAKRLRKSRAA